MKDTLMEKKDLSIKTYKDFPKEGIKHLFLPILELQKQFIDEPHT